MLIFYTSHHTNVSLESKISLPRLAINRVLSRAAIRALLLAVVAHPRVAVVDARLRRNRDDVLALRAADLVLPLLAVDHAPARAVWAVVAAFVDNLSLV